MHISGRLYPLREAAEGAGNLVHAGLTVSRPFSFLHLPPGVWANSGGGGGASGSGCHVVAMVVVVVVLVALVVVVVALVVVMWWWP